MQLHWNFHCTYFYLDCGDPKNWARAKDIKTTIPKAIAVNFGMLCHLSMIIGYGEALEKSASPIERLPV